MRDKKSYTVIGDSYQRFYHEIKTQHLTVLNMKEKSGILYLEIPLEFCSDFEKLCNELKLEHNQTGVFGPLTKLKRLWGRPGIIAGLLLTIILTFILSNTALRFTILTSDNNIKKSIMNVLREENVRAGTFIPNIDIPVCERAIRKKVPNIAWAGISRKGCVIIIDILEAEKTEDIQPNRLPSNLVACENGVIDKISVVDGQLKKGIGSGVSKGDIIVSGTVTTVNTTWENGKEITDKKISYARSKGKIYGTFERTMTFFQPFKDREEYLTGETCERKFLQFYDAYIPMNIFKLKSSYKQEKRSCTLDFLGVKLPIGVTTYKLSEYKFRTKLYSENESKKLAENAAYKYEKNFLKSYVIKSRNAKVKTSKKGVSVTVTYKLHGVISKEVEFFIKK